LFIYNVNCRLWSQNKTSKSSSLQVVYLSVLDVVNVVTYVGTKPWRMLKPSILQIASVKKV